MLVSRKWISTALGLLALTVAAPALAQGTTPSRNQMTADAVASALRASSGLAASQIEIESHSGVVTLAGTVASPSLKAEAIVRARQVPGVVNVVNNLRIVGDRNVRPADFQPAPTQVPQVAMGLHHGHGGGEVIYDGAAMGAPMDGGMMNYGGPVPEGAAVPGATQAAMPGSPNYAWPSYAPYPNYSAVGYPTAYPWQAWPNIGPFYPYPEVPLDWRAVTLRWDDGIWWLDFRKHYTRPFFTPYPFGILAY